MEYLSLVVQGPVLEGGIAQICVGLVTALIVHLRVVPYRCWALANCELDRAWVCWMKPTSEGSEHLVRYCLILKLVINCNSGSIQLGSVSGDIQHAGFGVGIKPISKAFRRQVTYKSRTKKMKPNYSLLTSCIGLCYNVEV